MTQVQHVMDKHIHDSINVYEDCTQNHMNNKSIQKYTVNAIYVLMNGYDNTILKTYLGEPKKQLSLE